DHKSPAFHHDLDADLYRRPSVRNHAAGRRRRRPPNGRPTLRPGSEAGPCWASSRLNPVKKWSRTAAGSDLRRLLDLEPELADRLLAHHELLDLAGDGHREFADEFDVARDLVVGDLALAELPDLLGRGALARPELDPGADLLAVPGIGHADHLHVLHLGMAVEEFLDLSRIDVLAAPDDHVLQAADDVDVALVIHGGEVAGMHPAAVVDCLLGLLLIVPVALHHRVAARAELAGRPARHRLALAVDDLDLDVRQHLAHGRDAALDRIVGGALRGDRRGLGHAVGDGDLAHVHLALHPLHHLDRAWRARHDAGAQALEIELAELGMV